MNNNVIGFFNTTSLSGKTISCLFFGIILAKLNYKILLIDYDTKSSLSKLCIQKKNHDDLFKYLDNKKEVKQIIHKNIVNNIDLINVSIDSALVLNDLTNEYYLRLSKLLYDLKQEYNFILIDFSSFLNDQNKIALSLCDQIIIPLVLSKNTISNIKQELSLIYQAKSKFNSNTRINGCFFNFFNDNDITMLKYYTEIVKIFNEYLYEIKIPFYQNLIDLNNINELDQLVNKNEFIEYVNLIKSFLERKEIKND